ncbi:MAG: radical SAM protein, partial [Candidatus Eremiobacteraeota bacterium]|nr:radical SAM protein [Candidatus Eremiobacteraeota bacterium]
MATTQLLQKTSSLCTVCKRGVEAEIVEHEGAVYLRKSCPEHGSRTVLLASDAAWYHETMTYPAALVAPALVKKEIQQGCPYDCGACGAHQQKTYLPVIPITSVCNLDCPICYTINKNQEPFHISKDEFAQILEVMRHNDPERKIINLTGGEPTLHPDLPGIVRLCHEAGIHRVTISTHGLAFLKNDALLEELSELRARIVLSFDSFEDAINRKMLGANCTSAKLRVLDRLEQFKL